MSDPRLVKYADVLVKYSVKTQPGDWDFICDTRHDTEMFADGKLIYQNGKFLV